MIKKGDVVLIVCIMAITLLWYAGMNSHKGVSDSEHKIAIVKHDNEIIKKIDLNEVKDFEQIAISEEYEQTILIENGRIRFEESGCPDKVCVKTGWLSQKGQTAVCVPNKTIIVIEGEEREVDGVTY